MPTPIAILGSGISALTTALTLQRQGRAFTLYSDPAFNAASAVAPAMFTPYSPTPDAAFRRRTKLSLRVFTDLAAARTPGIHLGELREYLYTPSPAPSWLESLLDTRDIPAPPPVRRATASHRPHIEMDRYLPWLFSQLPAPVPLRAPTFDAVFARGHSILINCAGLGARELTSDPLLKPMHGQVLHVPNDLGLTYSLHDDAPGGLVAYIFNFGNRLILGGTFETGREDAGTDEPTLAAIVDRCRTLLRLDGHPRWADLARTRVAVRAAARPTRGGPDTFEAIRLEREDLPGSRRVIHNYGHGRTGVTLSWGCAEEAAHLACAD